MLRVEDNKSGSTFHDKFGNAILSAISKLWNNILIVRIYIFKHNVSNSINLIIRHLGFETLYCHFEHTSNNVKIINGGLHFLFFYFFFSLYFSFLFFSIFRTTQVRVYQSCCHISHKTDYETWENGVEGSGIK